MQLAVELARKFDGEIINGDAMQLYHGLPVITNKITNEETKGVPHHLLGCIGLEQETWTVGKFVSNALDIVGISCAKFLSVWADLARSKRFEAEASFPYL